MCTGTYEHSHLTKKDTKGKRGNPLKAGGFPTKLLDQTQQVCFEQKEEEKVIWEMITEHSSNPFTDLKC